MELISIVQQKSAVVVAHPDAGTLGTCTTWTMLLEIGAIGGDIGSIDEWRYLSDIILLVKNAMNA